jgi:hypothetical protein
MISKQTLPGYVITCNAKYSCQKIKKLQKSSTEIIFPHIDGLDEIVKLFLCFCVIVVILWGKGSNLSNSLLLYNSSLSYYEEQKNPSKIFREGFMGRRKN